MTTRTRKNRQIPASAPTQVNGTLTSDEALLRAATMQASAELPTPANADQLAVEENHIRRLARIADILSSDIYTVNYYVPTRQKAKKVAGEKRKRSKGGLRNPKRIFRKYGVYLDGSHLVMTKTGWEHPEVQDWVKKVEEAAALVPEESCGLEGFTMRKRPRVWKTLYTKGQIEAMREDVVDQMSVALQMNHRSMIRRIDKAGERLRKAQEKLSKEASECAQSEVEGDWLTSLRGTMKVACERFEMALRGAEIFDDTGKLDSLFKASREAIATRVTLINGLLEKKGMKKVAVPATISAPTPYINGTSVPPSGSAA